MLLAPRVDQPIVLVAVQQVGQRASAVMPGSPSRRSVNCLDPYGRLPAKGCPSLDLRWRGWHRIDTRHAVAAAGSARGFLRVAVEIAVSNTR